MILWCLIQNRFELVILCFNVFIGEECSSGVVGFAHPSPLHIGNTHGVFVVEDEGSVLRKVKKFLHKPSNEEMKNEGAVFIKDGKEMVFTDSSYFFFSDVTRKLVKFVKEHPNIDCEIDAYGDFLQVTQIMERSNSDSADGKQS